MELDHHVLFYDNAYILGHLKFQDLASVLIPNSDNQNLTETVQTKRQFFSVKYVKFHLENRYSSWDLNYQKHKKNQNE